MKPNPNPARDDYNYKVVHAELVSKSERELRSIQRAYENNKANIKWQVVSDLIYDFDSNRDGSRYRMSLTLSILAIIVSLIALYLKLNQQNCH